MFCSSVLHSSAKIPCRWWTNKSCAFFLKPTYFFDISLKLPYCSCFMLQHESSQIGPLLQNARYARDSSNCDVSSQQWIINNVNGCLHAFILQWSSDACLLFCCNVITCSNSTHLMHTIIFVEVRWWLQKNIKYI